MDSSHLAWRLGIFLSVLLLMLAAEHRAPRRTDPPLRRLRWCSNVGLSLISTLLVAALPLSMIAVATLGQDRGWGLMRALALGPSANLVLGLLLLDLAIYWQHRALHRWAPLWRLHRVHHSDIVLDTSSGLRFHPGEILLSLFWKCGVTLLIGAAPLTVLVYEIALNACSLFNHANWRLPPRADGLLRRLLVTPDMHRVHHSTDPTETNRNFGNGLSVWDHVFASYRAQPARGQLGMRIGLPDGRGTADQGLPALLLQPWRARRN